MSNDQFTEVTSQGWFSRIGDSIKGIFGGIILVLLSCGLLFWNEGRAVVTAQSLEEGSSAVVSAPADKVDTNNEGKLIHVSGPTKVEETLSDDQFGVQAKAVRLRRSVEMYQWEETSKSEERKKLGGGTEKVTTYSYNKVWKEGLSNSSSFKNQNEHSNPSSLPYEQKSWDAAKVDLGAFTLSPSLVGGISNFTPLDPAPKTGEAGVASAASNFPSGVKYQAGKLVNVDQNPSTPKVGDVRISFAAAMPTTVSIVAQQAGNSFRPYQTKAGRALEMLSMGSKSAPDMFAAAMQENTLMTWGLRILGFILIYAGISMLFQPLVVLADVIPFLGNLLGAGVSMISFVMAMPIALIVIALGWITYRPMLGIALLVVAVVILGGGIMMALAAKKAMKPAAVPQA